MKEHHTLIHLNKIQPINPDVNPYINPFMNDEGKSPSPHSPRFQEWFAQYEAWLDDYEQGVRNQPPIHPESIQLDFR